MFRIQIMLGKTRQTYRYLDSVHGALINGLTATGISFDKLAGMNSDPWTFACKGYARPNGEMTLKSILVSTASPTIAEAMKKLNPSHLVKVSANGDMIDLRESRVAVERRGLVPGQDEVCVAFASRFALPLPKNGARVKTAFCRTPSDTNFSDAIKSSLDRRARRELDIQVSIDRLTLMTEGTPRFISLRKAGTRRIMIPAFNMPITLRGKPEDVAFAFHSGMGAKANQGFGCPIIQG
jgi:CRISPR-associated endoribonuclease Cas6